MMLAAKTPSFLLTRPLDASLPQTPSLRPLFTPPVASSSAPIKLPSVMSATSVSTTPTNTASRKRKMLVRVATPVVQKRVRTWTDLEFEEMLEEAALLREELELLLAVAQDLCLDLSLDPANVLAFVQTLTTIEDKMATQGEKELSVAEICEMCRQMVTMMQYLCQVHYDHFALVDMQDHVRECRDRFMRFVCQYATMIGLRR